MYFSARKTKHKKKYIPIDLNLFAPEWSKVTGFNSVMASNRAT